MKTQYIIKLTDVESNYDIHGPRAGMRDGYVSTLTNYSSVSDSMVYMMGDKKDALRYDDWEQAEHVIGEPDFQLAFGRCYAVICDVESDGKQCIVTQTQGHQVGNACVLRDRRLTQWERDFVCSLMDSNRLADVTKLSAKQQGVLLRIADKVCDVLPI